IPSFPYELLWGERSVRSVANLTRADAAEFLPLAAQVPVRTEVEVYPIAQANEALERLRAGGVRGAAVLSVRPVWAPAAEREGTVAYRPEGTYFENCNCDVLCPRGATALARPADHERCQLRRAFHRPT